MTLYFFLYLLFYCLVSLILYLDVRFTKTSGLISFYFIFLFLPYIYYNKLEDFLTAFLLFDRYLFWLAVIINFDFLFSKLLCFWLFWFFNKVNLKKTSYFVSKLSFICSLYFIIFLVNWFFSFLKDLIYKVDNAYLLLLLNMLTIIVSVLYFFIVLFENYSQLFFYTSSKKLKWYDLLEWIYFILIILVVAHLFDISFLLVMFIYFFIRASYDVIVEARVIHKKDRISLNFLYWFYKNLYKLVYNCLNYKQLEVLVKLYSNHNYAFYNIVFYCRQYFIINSSGTFWFYRNLWFLFENHGFFVERILWSRHNLFIASTEYVKLASKLFRLFNLSFREARAIMRNIKKKDSYEKKNIYYKKNLLTRGELLLGLVKVDPTVRMWGLGLADEESAEFLIIFLEFLKIWIMRTRKGSSNVKVYYLKENILIKRPKVAFVKDNGTILRYLQLVRSNHILNPKEFLNLLDQCEKDGHLLVLAVPFLSLQNQMDQLKADNIFKFYSSIDSSFSLEDAKLNEEKIRSLMRFHSIIESVYINMQLPWTTEDLKMYELLIELAVNYYSRVLLKDIDDKIFFDQLLSNILLDFSSLG